MTQKEFDITELLNNDSFISWLKGTSTTKETITWQQWHDAKPENRQLTMKARKIVHMPFNNEYISADEIRREVQKFDKRFMRLIKKPGSLTSFF